MSHGREPRPTERELERVPSRRPLVSVPLGLDEFRNLEFQNSSAAPAAKGPDSDLLRVLSRGGRAVELAVRDVSMCRLSLISELLVSVPAAEQHHDGDHRRPPAKRHTFRNSGQLRERVLQIERALPGALATLPVSPEVN